MTLNSKFTFSQLQTILWYKATIDDSDCMGAHVRQMYATLIDQCLEDGNSSHGNQKDERCIGYSCSGFWKT